MARIVEVKERLEKSYYDTFLHEAGAPFVHAEQRLFEGSSRGHPELSNMGGNGGQLPGNQAMSVTRVNFMIESTDAECFRRLLLDTHVTLTIGCKECWGLHPRDLAAGAYDSLARGGRTFVGGHDLARPLAICARQQFSLELQFSQETVRRLQKYSSVYLSSYHSKIAVTLSGILTRDAL